MILARTVILVERELESAIQSIQYILQGVDMRVRQLTGMLPSCTDTTEIYAELIVLLPS